MMDQYVCPCGYEYDPAVGGPDNGVAPGTPWEDVPTDYDRYDYFLGMDQWNIRNMKRILGGDPENKVHLLLDFTGRPGEEIADPWYTGDFERTYADILEGCTGFLRQSEF